MESKFKPGDFVYIPNTDWIFMNNNIKQIGNIVEILKVDVKTKTGQPWYTFRFIKPKNWHSNHNGYDHDNLADKTWIKVGTSLKTIEVLYGESSCKTS